MVTNPTKRIRTTRIPNPFGTQADDLLHLLAGLPPSTDAPYLTVSLDWTVEGSNPGRAEPQELKRSQNRSGWEQGARARPSMEVIDRQLEALIDNHGPRGGVYDSLEEDREKIRAWLENDLDPAAQGALIVACAARGVFHADGFALPLPTALHFSATPALYTLVRLIEDNPAYAVLLVDQTNATLSFVTYGRVNESVTLEGTGYPRHQQTGGLSQRRLQRRANERIEAFARDVAQETRTALEEMGVEALIVAGDEVITSALDSAFHGTVKERIVDTIRLDMTAEPHEVIAATLPIAEGRERAEEAENVDALRDAVGADDRGVSGPNRTLGALAAGQVSKLLMLDTFEGIGWADYDMPAHGIGNRPDEHPLGGDVSAMEDVDLRDEMIRLAVLTGAEVDIIHSDRPGHVSGLAARDDRTQVTGSAQWLTELGGVGALLRYSMFEPANTVS